MIDGFGLDDNIKLIFDGDIIVKPSVPLSQEDKDFLIEKFFKEFHKEMRYRLYISKCLEANEIQEYNQNPNFLQGRAFIFMNRCLNRFDKGRYKGQEFGVLTGDNHKIDRHDFDFIKSFNILGQGPVYYFEELKLGSTYLGFKRALSRYPDLENKLKKNVALARLKFFWFNFYRDSINQLAGETIKWKKNKGIPTKPDLKKAGIRPDEFISTLKEVQDYQVKSRSVPAVVEDEAANIYTFENYSNLEDELMVGMSWEFRRFFFFANVLKMEHQEMVLEFGDDFKSLKEAEMNFKKELKRLTSRE